MQIVFDLAFRSIYSVRSQRRQKYRTASHKCVLVAVVRTLADEWIARKLRGVAPNRLSCPTCHLIGGTMPIAVCIVISAILYPG
jgi:hypothetical protein